MSEVRRLQQRRGLCSVPQHRLESLEYVATNPSAVSTGNFNITQRQSRRECQLMARQTNAPKFITWIVSLVLFVVAITAHFGLIQVSSDIASWSWIIGYALLLVAVQTKGL
jgi:hypothetical protein